MSSLALVLLLLVLGSLMLTGLNQQLDALRHIVTAESLAIQHQVTAQSALEWGRVQSWQAESEFSCQQHPQQQQQWQWRACLRILGERAVLIARSGAITLWRLGEVTTEGVVFSPHGWSDFCPLEESALCQQP